MNSPWPTGPRTRQWSALHDPNLRTVDDELLTTILIADLAPPLDGDMDVSEVARWTFVRLMVCKRWQECILGSRLGGLVKLLQFSCPQWPAYIPVDRVAGAAVVRQAIGVDVTGHAIELSDSLVACLSRKICHVRENLAAAWPIRYHGTARECIEYFARMSRAMGVERTNAFVAIMNQFLHRTITKEETMRQVLHALRGEEDLLWNFCVAFGETEWKHAVLIVLSQRVS